MKLLHLNTERLLLALFLSIAIFSICSCNESRIPELRRLQCKHSHPICTETRLDQLKSYNIDLPEEIQGVDSTDNLGASIDDETKTIHFYFKHN